MRQSCRMDSKQLSVGAGALQDSINGPRGVFGDQRLWVASRALERWQILARSDVSERDANVPEKSAALDPLNRRTAKQVTKLSFVKRQIIAQRQRGCRSSRSERSLARNFREAVPGTRVEAVITTKNAIANQWSEFERN